jgi:subtilisin family serine protease
MMNRRSVCLVGSVIAIAVHAIAGADQWAPKLDEGLSGEVYHAIFVRMEDQLFKKAADYDSFCRKNESEKRSILRPRVLQQLRANADQSWERIKARVAKLESAGRLKDTTRFWIVNGFACEATAAACQSLADDPNVSFIYLQRGPPLVRQHSAGSQREQAGSQPVMAEDQRTSLEKLLKEYRSDVDEPFDSRGLEIPWNLRLIQADQVWEREHVDGRGAVVALNDSGIMNIPALRPALWRNVAENLNAKDDDKNGYVDDLFGYNFAQQSGNIFDDSALLVGTMCAGIIAGRPLPDHPLVTGVAPRARIMPLNGTGYLKAYEYALANGADVISMSYMWFNVDLGQYRGLFRTAAEHLSAAGVMAVGGAGNFFKSAPPGKQICLPKDIPCVMAVSGVVEDAKPYEVSSRGPCTWTGVRFYDDYPPSKPLRKPDVCAPAGDFPVWNRAGIGRAEWKEVWIGKSSEALIVGPNGCSLAGPHVAGVAALVFSANPELNAWQVKRIIEETSRDLGDPGPDNQYGAGLVQALEAVRKAKGLVK